MPPAGKAAREGGGYDWAFLRAGARRAASLPGLVMFLSFTGFGALAHSMRFPLPAALATDVFVWALPGQVVLVDDWTRGLPLALSALAVTLTAVRLLPMVVLVLARARVEGNPRWPEYLAAHFIAATLWVMSEMHMGAVPRRGRIPWLIGLGATLMTVMTGATVLGYLLTGAMPLPLAATLVFFTPAFFLMALAGGARARMDWLAIAAGLTLAPFVHALWPDFDLLIAGAGGGLLAWGLPRPARGEGRR